MTISSSLNAGVSGLSANASRLATISDNIANSATYGYKRAQTDFQSMVMTGDSNSAYVAGGGARHEYADGRYSGPADQYHQCHRSCD
jgi:flagellar hook protein FlgE